MKSTVKDWLLLTETVLHENFGELEVPEDWNVGFHRDKKVISLDVSCRDLDGYMYRSHTKKYVFVLNHVVVGDRTEPPHNWRWYSDSPQGLVDEVVAWLNSKGV